MTKLLENIFRCVNIALVNELKLLSQRMDIDIWEAIESAATKPFGFMPFYPGPGLGGHCIPVDPFYLSWKARQAGVAALALAVLGALGAWTGGAGTVRPALRVVLWGAIAMAVTYGVGLLFGAVV